MEQEETTVDPQYQKGFNDGYLLAKHEPKLATQLTSTPNDQNPYLKGLTAGKLEYDREIREWANSFSKGQPSRDDRAADKER